MFGLPRKNSYRFTILLVFSFALSQIFLEQYLTIITIITVLSKKCIAATRIQETVTAKACQVINACVGFRMAHFYNLSRKH